MRSGRAECCLPADKNHQGSAGRLKNVKLKRMGSQQAGQTLQSASMGRRAVGSGVILPGYPSQISLNRHRCLGGALLHRAAPKSSQPIAAMERKGKRRKRRKRFQLPEPGCLNLLTNAQFISSRGYRALGSAPALLLSEIQTDLLPSEIQAFQLASLTEIHIPRFSNTQRCRSLASPAIRSSSSFDSPALRAQFLRISGSQRSSSIGSPAL